jgi:hypothetical protein
MWAPVVAWQISKRFSSFCHVFISMWRVISWTASMIRCLKSARSRNFLLYTTSLINPHAKKVKWCQIRRSRGPGSRTSSSDILYIYHIIYNIVLFQTIFVRNNTLLHIPQ